MVVLNEKCIKSRKLSDKFRQKRLIPYGEKYIRGLKICTPVFRNFMFALYLLYTLTIFM